MHTTCALKERFRHTPFESAQKSRLRKVTSAGAFIISARLWEPVWPHSCLITWDRVAVSVSGGWTCVCEEGAEHNRKQANVICGGCSRVDYLERCGVLDEGKSIGSRLL